MKSSILGFFYLAKKARLNFILPKEILFIFLIVALVPSVLCSYYSFSVIFWMNQVFFFNLNLFILIGGYYFTILYWFCHTATGIRHGCTWVPNPEPPSHLSPHILSLGHPSAPAPSILYPVSCIEPRLAIRFLHDSIHVSTPFSQIIPPSPSPTESESLFYTSVSLLLSRIQGYHFKD